MMLPGPWCLLLLALHVVLMEHLQVLLLEPRQVVDHENHLVRNPEPNEPAGGQTLHHLLVEIVATAGQKK